MAYDKYIIKLAIIIKVDVVWKKFKPDQSVV